MFDKILNKLSKYWSAEDLEVDTEQETIIKEPDHIMIAKSYHGLHEVHHNKTLKKLLGFNPAKTPWCAGFVNAIEKACGRSGTGKLLARSYLTYGRPAYIPKKGDIVVLQRGNSSWQGHVAYFIQKDTNGILCLGGNQNNKVCYKYYPEKRVLGYRAVS